MKSRKQTGICIALIIALVIFLAVGLWGENAINDSTKVDGSEKQILFSYESGFYPHDITIEMTNQSQGEILYTLDGSLPSPENGNTMRYDAKADIYLPCAQQEQVYTIKAAIYDDKNDFLGKVYSRTYILGYDVNSRYSTPVLTISGNPEEILESEEAGILSSSNRLLKGREYEREVSVTLFDQEGKETFSLECGLRVHGTFSREKNQPSFRLYARSEYDENNLFNYYFFDDDYNTANVLIPRYKRIILRNGGNDNGYAYLRNELANRLGSMAGFPDTQHSSPICIYVNGEYFGVYWFINNFDEWYFAEKYGEYDGRMVILEGTASELVEKEDEDELSKRIREEYNAFYLFGSSADLSVDKNWETINQTMDVENFLQYAAIQNYLWNEDSFRNNFKVYRYFSPSEEYTPGTVFDGKYRFLLYDLDNALDFGVDISESKASRLRTAELYILGNQYFYGLFNNIISRPEGRDMYVRYYLSLANYYFAPAQAIPVMYEMHESHANELEYLYNETNLLDGNIFMPEDANYDYVLSEVEKIGLFLENRPEFALEELKETFGLEQTYDLFLRNHNEATVDIDYISFHETAYNGTYFYEVPVTLSVTPKCGYKFDHWLVNGNKVEAEQVLITSDMIENGIVDIECVTSEDPETALLISIVNSNGMNDFVILTNYGNREVNLRDYLLWDGEKGTGAVTLPSAIIAPQESVTVYCDNYVLADALWQPCVNFNLKAGETLMLYTKDGTLIQSVDIPQLGSEENIYTMNIYDRTFHEEIR